ncbi:MAG TPA: flagellar biosynthetic protein FliO [Stellaceae bacterium]|nr:flagellar biosynthetic protein FliO [Stellaceae bacterium]
MHDLVSGELYLRVILALSAMVAVLAVAALAARRFGLANRFGQAGKRLGIIEAAAIDAKRRLVLLRRDEVEHLVLIGPDGATVVETGIRSAAPAALDAQGAAR